MKRETRMLALSSTIADLVAVGSVVAEPPKQQAPPVVGAMTLGLAIAESDLIATGRRAAKLIGAVLNNGKGEEIGKIDDLVIAPF